MNEIIYQQKNRQVAWWLLAGVFMIMIQVVLGGITRLTGSGLSITEWKPLLGTLPPLNTADWELAFNQYKQIGQYKHINFDFSLSDFKFIYFWEWFHRVWARLIGLVFIIPFLYFIIKKKISTEMIIPLIILFLLGLLQAMIGWIMVKSGLNENDISVSHIRLSLHFISAFILLCYTFWFALSLLVKSGDKIFNPGVKYLTLFVLGILTLQLVYGAFMAGLKAGGAAPTWPTINGNWWPEGIGKEKGLDNLTSNPIMVQFIHRLLAYFLLVAIFFWYFKMYRIKAGRLFERTKALPLILVNLQVVLGIATVLQSPVQSKLLWWGVSHQFVAMLLVLSLILSLYLCNKRESSLN